MTGMSGTGKSTALAELERRGFAAVDTDVGGWTEWSDAEGGYVWREDRVAELLARDVGDTLFVSGTVSNQGRFYPRFDAIVLLSAPAEVLLARIEGRTTNDYGKTAEERDLILGHLAEVEPLLRATCTHEIDASAADRGRRCRAGGDLRRRRLEAIRRRMIMETRIDTDRLTIQPMRPEDAEDLFAIMREPAIGVALGEPPPESATAMRERIESWGRGPVPERTNAG